MKQSFEHLSYKIINEPSLYSKYCMNHQFEMIELNGFSRLDNETKEGPQNILGQKSSHQRANKIIDTRKVPF